MEDDIVIQPVGKKIKRRTIVRFFVNFFVYVLIVVGLVFGLPRGLSWALNTPYPMAAITSGSMWPALKEGSLVFIQGVSKDALKIGDIVVYRNGATGSFVIHRVVELGEDTMTTKGDANFTRDAPVAYRDLVGRSVTVGGKPFSIPYLGSVTVFASNLKHERTGN